MFKVNKQLRHKFEESTLLYFGIDTIRLSITNYGTTTFDKPVSIQFLEFFFQDYLDDTNEAIERTFLWGTQIVNTVLTYQYKKGSRIAYIEFKGHKILTITELTEDSHLRMNLGVMSDYIVTFYGAFFSFVRLGLLDLNDCLGDFVQDTINQKIRTSVTRLDVSVDLTNVTQIDVFNTVDKKDPTKCKKWGGIEFEINNDSIIQSGETIYYGRSNDPQFHICIYDKFKRAKKFGVTDLYFDYFDHKVVTRVELQVDGDCKQYGVALLNLLDDQYILNLFATKLQGKYCHWHMFDYVANKLGNTRFEKLKRLPVITLQRISNMPRFWRLHTQNTNFANDLKISLPELHKYIEDMPEKLPPDSLKYHGIQEW